MERTLFRVPGISRRRERGAALLLTLVALSLVLLTLLVGLTMTEYSRQMIKRQLTYQGQALNGGSAGIVEAQSWFVRQKQQPVLAFEPQLDLDGVCPHDPPHVPPVNETEDPDIGLVRSFMVTEVGNVWGRLEVDRGTVRDVSLQRGKPSAGTIWEVTSEGKIYVQNDEEAEPDAFPNRLLAHRTVKAELQRLAIQLPANAALNASEGRRVNVSPASRVQGGASGIGIAYPPATGTPSVARPGTVTGNPPQNTTTVSFALKDVFGVSLQELSTMAQLSVDDVNDLPRTLPDMSLIVIRGNATFTPERPLTGSGILVVIGNLVVNPESNSNYSGVIYTTGTFVFGDSNTVSGSVIATGNVQLTGGASVSELIYDPDILEQVRLQLGNYMLSRTPYIVGAGGES